MDVVVVGGKNSAAIAALELWRSGARVTLVHRGPEIQPHVKYWIKPDIENRIKNGDITAHFNSRVVEITPDAVVIETPQGRISLKNIFVFAMTGYHPDFEFLEALGVRLEGEDRLPVCDPQPRKATSRHLSRRRNRRRLPHQRDIIENGRHHGRQIAAALTAK